MLDLIVALGAVPVVAPLMVVVAAAVRLRIGRPVIFRQNRPGWHGAGFDIYKFRTMTEERGPDGQLLSDTQRLTRLGRFLRKTSLDELPELLNVIRGDMSLVGPRPLLHRYTPFLTARERQRALVRPGITGWAQVQGRNTAPWDRRLELDVWYVENRSMWLDLKILALTLVRVLSSAGVHVDPGAAMVDLDAERALPSAQTVAQRDAQ